MRNHGAIVLLLLGSACGKESEKSPAASPGTAAATSATSAKKAAVGNAKRDDAAFGFSSAHIVYKYTGQEEGRVEAWVADGGKTVLLVRDMTKPMPDKRTLLWRDGKTTLWSAGGKAATSRFRPKDTELRLVSTNDPRQLEMGGYVKEAPATVAGKECEVWRHPKNNVTFWRWQGADLKVENGAGSAGIVQTIEAERVETDVTIPPELLQPPS
jgi:hypothetical protein